MNHSKPGDKPPGVVDEVAHDPANGLIQQDLVKVTLIKADGEKLVIIQQLGNGIRRAALCLPYMPPSLVRDIGVFGKAGRPLRMERLEMVGHPGFEEYGDRVLFPSIGLCLRASAPIRPDGDRNADHGGQGGRRNGNDRDEGLVLFRRGAWNLRKEGREFSNQQSTAHRRKQHYDSDEESRSGDQEKRFQRRIKQRSAPGGLPVTEPLAGKAVTKTFKCHRISPPSRET